MELKTECGATHQTDRHQKSPHSDQHFWCSNRRRWPRPETMYPTHHLRHADRVGVIGRQLPTYPIESHWQIAVGTVAAKISVRVGILAYSPISVAAYGSVVAPRLSRIVATRWSLEWRRWLTHIRRRPDEAVSEGCAAVIDTFGEHFGVAQLAARRQGRIVVPLTLLADGAPRTFIG